MNVENKIYLAEKVIMCSKGLKGAPSKTLKLFFLLFAKCFFVSKCFFFFYFFLSIFMKNSFAASLRFFSQKYVRNKKERSF